MPIIIPPALLLSPSLTIPLTHARILWQTYTRNADPSTITASSALTDSPADAVTRPDTYECWQAESLPATWEIDLGEAKDIDAVGIVSFGNHECSFLVETSNNGSSWTEFSDEIAPANDAPLLFLDELRTVRYVRLTIEGLVSPSTAPRVAVIYIHQAMAMYRMIHGGHSPAPLSRTTVLKNALSRGGQFLGQNFRRHGVQTDVSYRNLPGDWYRETFDPFVQNCRKYPYFFAWRPARRPLEVAYVWTAKDIHPKNTPGRDYVDVSWDMHGIGFGDD